MAPRYLRKWVCELGHENWAYEFKCSCGKPRTRGVKWFTPSPKVEATDAQWALKGPGPNWFCNYCKCENPAYNKTNCGYCGGPIGAAETTVAKHGVKVKDVPRTADTAREYDKVTVDHGDAGWGMPEERPITSQNKRPGLQSILSQLPGFPSNDDVVKDSRQDSKKILTLAGIILGAVPLFLIGYGIWYAYLDTETYTAKVTGYYWEQTLALEELETLERTDWRSDMPSDAYNESCVYIFKEWTKEPDGTENVEVDATCFRDVPGEEVCDDDGAGGETNCRTPMDQEPYDCKKTETRTKYKDVAVHEDKCTYNIDRWTQIDSYTTNGNDHLPYYHTYSINDPSSFRTKEISGTYLVYFESDMVGPFSKDYNLDTWRRFDDQIGQICAIEVNRQNNVVGDPQPDRLP
ncbi:MAG: hypothetical protein UW68_C0053G0006 [Candidatus Collierbacteria bacterium GW2011_GWB1_44_6]|uniref:RanBP2-type domain-containing protein n=1 Tax=Candidatus Collierbacteria bacterium GW2011_GWB1_44_6 TaxID=1618384 RepID=A0A0G1LSR7_9BACT|nr:MAG: hypothetical protein UW68_C0053G0006 [Candidatus Collierbacteria bacterium GW2011_GWB1_44_6]